MMEACDIAASCEISFEGKEMVVGGLGVNKK